MSSRVYDPESIGLHIAGRSGDEMVVFCPYHHDNKPSAEYNVQKGLFYCFGCQVSKTAKQLAEDLGGYLVKVSGSSSFGFADSAETTFSREWIKLTMNPIALGSDYLKERMVEDWQIQKHSIKASSSAIIFELRNHLGNLEGIQVRNLNSSPKYLFHGNKTPVFPMQNLMKRGALFVVEGVFGALRAETFGINAVATLGASNVLKVSDVLKRLQRAEIFILMDSDPAGFLAAGKYSLLGFDVIISDHIKGDPDDWNLKQWLSINFSRDSLRIKDVNEIINRSPDPQSLQWKLEKFWEKI